MAWRGAVDSGAFQRKGHKGRKVLRGDGWEYTSFLVPLLLRGRLGIFFCVHRPWNASQCRGFVRSSVVGCSLLRVVVEWNIVLCAWKWKQGRLSMECSSPRTECQGGCRSRRKTVSFWWWRAGGYLSYSDYINENNEEVGWWNANLCIKNVHGRNAFSFVMSCLWEIWKLNVVQMKKKT